MGLRLSGLATGLDTSQLVSALLEFERRPLDLLEQRRSSIESQQSAFREVNSLLLELRDAARAIDNQNDSLTGGTLDEEFLAYTATTSDSSVATVSVSGNATAGSTDLVVTEMATVGRRFTIAVPTDDGPILPPTGTISIDYGGTENIDITIGPGPASLRDMVELINTDENNGGNVVASVLYDGTNYRMVVSGVQTGAANDVDLTLFPPLVDGTLDQNATDAQLQVFGVGITRPTNAVEDVVPGVTVTLTGTTEPDEPITIDVERDDAGMQASLQGLADAYNKIRAFMTEQTTFDTATGTAGILSGDSTLRGVERQIQTVLGDVYSIGTNPLSSLAEIGLRFNDDGELELDAEVFSSAMDSDPLQVRELLGGDGTTDGAATALARLLEPIVRKSSPSQPPEEQGIMSVRDQGFDDRLESLDRQIERFEFRLGLREELLVQTFSRLEATIARLQAQGNFLSSSF